MNKNLAAIRANGGKLIIGDDRFSGRGVVLVLVSPRPEACCMISFDFYAEVPSGLSEFEQLNDYICEQLEQAPEGSPVDDLLARLLTNPTSYEEFNAECMASAERRKLGAITPQPDAAPACKTGRL